MMTTRSITNKIASIAPASQRAQGTGKASPPAPSKAKAEPRSNSGQDQAPRRCRTMTRKAPRTSAVAKSRMLIQCSARRSKSPFMAVTRRSARRFASALVPRVTRGTRADAKRRAYSKTDSLHAVVLRVDDVDPAVAVDGHGPGLVEPPRFSSRTAPAAERLAFFGELLHAMVAVLDDVQIAVRVERQVVGIGQLPRLTARLAPAVDELAVASEHLDPMIRAVGHVQQAVGPKGERPDASEFSRLGPFPAPALDEFAIGSNLLMR